MQLKQHVGFNNSYCTKLVKKQLYISPIISKLDQDIISGNKSVLRFHEMLEEKQYYEVYPGGPRNTKYLFLNRHKQMINQGFVLLILYVHCE